MLAEEFAALEYSLQYWEKLAELVADMIIQNCTPGQGRTSEGRRVEAATQP